MITFEDIKRINSEIQTVDIKDKQYATVAQRIIAFRKLFPEGTIKTELVSNENGVCVIHATVGYRDNGEFVILGEGTAYEKESSSFINKASYIENCETSAVGRALGMCGFGIDADVASADEVQTANLNTEPISAEQKKALSEMLRKAEIPAGYVCELYGVEQIKELNVPKYLNLTNHWDEFVKKYNERKNS